MPVANARMYAVTPAAEAAWAALLGRAGDASGIPLAYAAHPAPAPLETLWARDDLGLAFMCGWPFANLYPDHRPVAAPVPAGGDGRPLYRTDLVVRAEDGSADLATALRGRLGWTAEHSQSGFHAVNAFLDGHAIRPAHIGPLVTPRRVIEALEAGAIDVGPLDSLWHAILRREEPSTAARLRIVASTPWRPAPLLVASPSMPSADVARLRAGLVGLGRDAAAAGPMAALGIAGFAPVERADYAALAAPPSA